MNQMIQIRKILAMLLCLSMVFSMLPIAAFAEEKDEPEQVERIVEEVIEEEKKLPDKGEVLPSAGEEEEEPVEEADVVLASAIVPFQASRDDGTWFFPLSKDHYVTGNGGKGFNDWAGCNMIGGSSNPQGTCPFHIGVHCRNCSSSSHNKYDGNGHRGMDIGAASGAPVYAAADGVAYYCDDTISGRGKTVTIEHKVDSTSSYYSYYQHLSSSAITNGMVVKAGAVIGYVGNTYGYGNHLHFAIALGAPGKKGTVADLNALEAPGWVIDYTKSAGSILVNPPDTSYEGFNQHVGSIRFTFNKDEVSIGGSNYITKQCDDNHPTYAKVKTVKPIYVYSLPCSEVTVSSSQKLRQLSTNEEVVVTRYIRNSNSVANYWLQLQDGGWIYAGDVSFVGFMNPFSFSGVGLTKTSSNVGDGIGVKGVLNVAGGTGIEYTITTRYKKAGVSNDMVSFTYFDSRVDLSGKVGTSSKFGVLSAGEYTFYVVANTTYGLYCPVGNNSTNWVWHDQKFSLTSAEVPFTVGRGNPIVTATGITLNNSSLSMNVGTSATLTATVSPANTTNKATTWTTSNSAVATVADGTVTAVGNGTATITCTAADGSGVKASCMITVNPRAVQADLQPIATTAYNGTYYELYRYDCTWEESAAFAGIKGGWTVTITSEGENKAIHDLIAPYGDIWLLGYRTDNGFKWSTTEPFTYTNWAPGEPNNVNMDENRMMMYSADGKWNDSVDSHVLNYVVVKHYAPWLIASTEFNGAKYELYSASELWASRAYSWDMAKASAASKGGWLATINSAEENDAVWNLIKGYGTSWIGGQYLNGNFGWITGEAFRYTNWNSGEPNGGSAEPVLVMYETTGYWNDFMAEKNDAVLYFVVEYPVTGGDIELIATTSFNGAYYELYLHESTWQEAASFAKSRGGTLPEITSEEENVVIFDLIAPYGAIWLNGIRSENSFKWEKTEDFSYKNWADGQPDNNYGGNEDRLMMLNSNGTWNDWPSWFVLNYIVVEYPVIEPQYISSMEFSGSDYELYSGIYSWGCAKAYAENKGGWLASIRSLEENHALQKLIEPFGNAWIGLEYQSGQYKWTTGEVCQYTAWAHAELNGNSKEPVTMMYNASGAWNDTAGTPNQEIPYFIVEYPQKAPKPIKTMNYAGHIYELYDGHYSWIDAQGYAESKNAYLAAISTADENAAIQAFIAPYGSAWIGMRKETGDYYWTAAWHNVQFTNWAESMPHGENWSCVMMDAVSGKWHDIVGGFAEDNCSYFVVEIPSNEALLLPASIRVIEESAFEASDVHNVYVSEGCVQISDHAFGNCENLTQVHIPSSVTSISANAFAGSANVMIYAPAGSVALKYAESMHIPFQAE